PRATAGIADQPAEYASHSIFLTVPLEAVSQARDARTIPRAFLRLTHLSPNLTRRFAQTLGPCDAGEATAIVARSVLLKSRAKDTDLKGGLFLIAVREAASCCELGETRACTQGGQRPGAAWLRPAVGSCSRLSSGLLPRRKLLPQASQLFFPSKTTV